MDSGPYIHIAPVKNSPVAIAVRFSPLCARDRWLDILL